MKTVGGGYSIHLEIMRIVAIFFVIFNHTAKNGFWLFSLYTPDSFHYWTSQIFFNSFVLVNCITIFISVKYWFQKIVVPNFWERLVCSMGASVFTVYLMHVGIMESSAFCKIWIVFHEKWHLNYMVAALLFCFLVLAAGYLITLVIRVLFNCMGIK